jgi:hypothetical protein
MPARAGTHVDVAAPRPSDVARGDALGPMPSGGACLDLVVCNLSPSLPRIIAPGDAVPAPWSLEVMHPRVTELGLPSYLSVLSPPVSWRQVEGCVEQACSQVAAVDKLLREVMAVVG